MWFGNNRLCKLNWIKKALHLLISTNFSVNYWQSKAKARKTFWNFFRSTALIESMMLVKNQKVTWKNWWNWKSVTAVTILVFWRGFFEKSEKSWLYTLHCCLSAIVLQPSSMVLQLYNVYVFTNLFSFTNRFRFFEKVVISFRRRVHPHVYQQKMVPKHLPTPSCLCLGKFFFSLTTASASTTASSSCARVRAYCCA